MHFVPSWKRQRTENSPRIRPRLGRRLCLSQICNLYLEHRIKRSEKVAAPLSVGITRIPRRKLPIIGAGNPS